MTDLLDAFEKFARIAHSLGTASGEGEDLTQGHPFDLRNIHPDIANVSLKLFDDGHYSQATFEALKFLDIQVKKLSKINDSGFKLMMTALSETNPQIKPTAMTTQSEIDEQMGYKHIFAGTMSAIRNPRGHDINFDPIDRCLDHLSLASVLLRRLENHL